jgi:hypothetical protein
MLQPEGAMSMAKVNLAEVEAEMKVLAEARVERIAGDAPALTTKQTAEIWGRSSSWVKSMQKAGRVPTIPFGSMELVPRVVAIIGLVKGV